MRASNDSHALLGSNSLFPKDKSFAVGGGFGGYRRCIAQSIRRGCSAGKLGSLRAAEDFLCEREETAELEELVSRVVKP
jgi:hypothetical protein